jgi:hypothetical protein
MGDSFPEVISTLIRARDLLLHESQQAGTQGDWVSAKTLIELAERADQLRKEIPEQATGEAPAWKKETPKPARAIEDDDLGRRSSPPESYPKYLIRDGALVKRGLQRGGEDVYEHAVPRDRYDQILRQLTKMASAFAHAKQRPFGVEQIQRGLDCPRYMTYVVVSLLMRERFLIRARKGSYTFAAPATFTTDAATLWDRLKGADIA